MSPSETVSRFIAAITSGRVDEASALCHEDLVFEKVPVLARWEVVDGRITLWRDYYDLSMWDRAFDGGYFAYMARRMAAAS
jgi:limonene-1,2-epoxide hydrolase